MKPDKLIDNMNRSKVAEFFDGFKWTLIFLGSTFIVGILSFLTGVFFAMKALGM